MAIKTMDELGEELCNYCELPESSKGVTSYGNGPVFCYDSGYCNIAYDAYLEQNDGNNE